MTFVPAKQPLEPWTWLGVPFLICVVLSFVLTIPIRVFNVGLPEPVFALVPAFAWAVIRPSVLAPFMLILLGLFLDLLWGGPTGLWGLALLAAYALTFAVRPTLTGRGVVGLWIWYGVACLLAFGVGVLITLLKTGTIPSPFALAWQIFITVLLYPLAGLLIARYEDADVRFR
jgi:rod shape-determining protein MreD